MSYKLALCYFIQINLILFCQEYASMNYKLRVQCTTNYVLCVNELRVLSTPYVYVGQQTQHWKSTIMHLTGGPTWLKSDTTELK